MVVCAKRLWSLLSSRQGQENPTAEGESKMKRIVALLTLAAAVCLSKTPALRADITTENTNFIDMAYMDLLQRSPNATEIANGLTALGSETRTLFAFNLETK